MLGTLFYESQRKVLDITHQVKIVTNGHCYTPCVLYTAAAGDIQ